MKAFASLRSPSGWTFCANRPSAPTLRILDDPQSWTFCANRPSAPTLRILDDPQSWTFCANRPSAPTLRILDDPQSWTFCANRPSALERAVRQSPKSRRLRMEPLENRALLTVDAFGTAALADVGESWGPDPAPAFSASVLVNDAAVIDVSSADTNLANASLSVPVETPKAVAPPSFEQLMESLDMIEIESLDDASDSVSLSFLDEAASATQLLNSLNLQDISQGEPRQVVFYDSSDADFDASTLNLDDQNVYYVDVANQNGADAESYSVMPRSGGSSINLTAYGSSAIPESATFAGSGGSDQGPYFGFTTPVIPYGYTAYVLFEGGAAVYGEDYLVMRATIDSAGVVTPNSYPVSGGATPNGGFKLDFSGFQTEAYCIVPRNDFTPESHKELVATLYLDQLSGGSDVDPPPVAYDSFTATIVDDDPANLAVYWRNGSNSTTGATLSGNPNGGGYRVFPEKVDSEAEVARNQVDVVFRLSASSSTDTVIHYKVLDPDNYISLGANQAIDVNYAGGDNRYTPVFQGTVTIPANQLEADESFVISDAYAGDNFIVVADTDSSAVATAALGTTPETRYQVVQPANNKPAYSPLLTVWRTLWVECDKVEHQNGDVAKLPTITAPVANRFEQACIKVRAYGNNSKVSDLVNGVYISDGWNSTSGVSPQDCATKIRDCSQTSNEDFWYVHAIAAIRQQTTNESNEPPTRTYSKSESGSNAPTLFIFDTTIWNMQQKTQKTYDELCSIYTLEGLASVLNVETTFNDWENTFTVTQIAALQSRAKTI